MPDILPDIPSHVRRPLKRVGWVTIALLVAVVMGAAMTAVMLFNTRKPEVCCALPPQPMPQPGDPAHNQKK